MKCIARLLLIALPVCSSNRASELSEMFGDAHDAGNVMNKLNGMVAGAQMKLAQAEHHHAKIVKRVRKKAETLFADEAKSFGNGIAQYSTDLVKASSELKSVLDVAKKGLAAAEAKPSKPGDWKDPEVADRAKLSAQVNSADRQLKRSERRQSRMVKEAEEKGEEALEEEAQKLGMKVGDMTPVTDKAKQSLESIAEAPLNAKEAPVASKVASTENVKALAKDLTAAVAKSQTDIAATGKRSDAFLGKAAKEVKGKTDALVQELASAQKEEIAKVLGKAPEAAKKPAAKKAAAAAAVKKTAAVTASKKPETAVAAKKPAAAVAATKPAVASKPAAAVAKPAAAVVEAKKPAAAAAKPAAAVAAAKPAVASKPAAATAAKKAKLF